MGTPRPLTGLRGRSLAGIVRDTGWVGANEFITLVTGLAVLNVLIIGLGPAQYGQYAAVQAIAATLTSLTCAWVVMLLFQHALQAKRDMREAFASSYGLTVVFGALAFVGGTALGHLAMPDVPLTALALFIGAELLGGIFVWTSTAAVQIQLGMPTAAKLRMSMTLVRFAVIVGLGVTGIASLESVALGLFVAYSLAGLAIFLWAVHRLGLSVVPGRPRKRDVAEGAPHAGVLASLAVQEDSDKVLMVRFAEPVEAGLYAAAYRLVSLGMIPMRALLGATHPRFLVDTPGVRREHLSRALRFSAPTAAYGVLALIGILVIAPFVPALLGSEYDGTPPLLAALAPLVLLRGLTLFPMNALLGLGAHRLRFLTILGCSVLNLGLNLALIPPYGATGAIVATMATEVVFVGAAWWSLSWAQRRHDAAQDESRTDRPVEHAQP